MKGTSVASSVGIVPEVLTFDNYERWSILMKNYLIGQGLWDVVSGDSSFYTEEEASDKIKHLSNKKGKKLQVTIPDLEQGLGDAYEVDREVSWKMKTAKALHIIQILCGQQIQDELFRFETAQSAWEHLASSYGEFSKDKLDGLPAVLLDYHSLDHRRKELFSMVESGIYIGNIIKDSDLFERSASGRTLLHVAVIAGNLKNVEKLVKEGRDKLVHMQDNDGDTALAIVARYTGNTDMAKCMVERKTGPREDVVETAMRFFELVTYCSIKTTKKFLERLAMSVPTTHEQPGKRTVETKKGTLEVVGKSPTVNTKIAKRMIEIGESSTVKIKKIRDFEIHEHVVLKRIQTTHEQPIKNIVETNKVEIREKLLEMQNKENIVPVLLAAANGQKELTTYLYSKTPSKVFEVDSQNRVLLLSLCINAEIFDVALRLLKRFVDLPKESLSIYEFSVPKLIRESLSLPSEILESDSHRQFSSLVALAKMPLAFPSGGTRFGLLKQIIYDNLSVEWKFREDYGIPNIWKLVLNVASVATVTDERPPNTSSTGSSSHFGLIGLIFHLVKFSGRLFGNLTVSIFLILIFPIKLLGLLLGGIFRGITYFLVQILIYLDILGAGKIYDQKYTHCEVIAILSYLSRGVREFNDLQLKEASAYGAMLHAARHGIIEFINAMREANPDLLRVVDGYNRGIFSYAVMYRKQNVFKLIDCLHERKEILRSCQDVFGNSLLHLAAHLGSSSDSDSKSGAALQMQREIQWFKAVEEVVHPKFKEAKNSDGKKPCEIFTENHDELVKVGEKWAKDTATSYTIVGTLITTIMFAAAFTVPGGNNQETGLPIFLHDNIFTAFLISDALSLFASATSVLIFIGILTSRYAEKDFLKSLPWKLVLGLFFLFLSVCSMIVAFCAAIIDMISKGYESHKWFIVIPIMSLGSIPIIVVVVSQVSFMHEILRSTWKNPIRSIKK